MKRIITVLFCLVTLVSSDDSLFAENSSGIVRAKLGNSNTSLFYENNINFKNINLINPATSNFSNPVVYVCPDQVVGYLPPSCDCDGKIIEMTVIYDGPNNATISVGPNSSGSNPFINTNTQSGDTLVINLGNIGNDWYYLVNGIQDANIHASCSDEILNNINSTKSDFGHLGSYPNPDQNSNDGTFLVIGFMDDKGNVCPVGGVNGIVGGATAIISSFPDSGLAPYSFIWSTGETTQNINVTLSHSTSYTVTVTDANGLTTSANHLVTVVNISCPGYPDKVIMCDNGSQKCVDENYICQKLADGYTLGPCGYDFSQPNNCGSVFSLSTCPCICDGKIIEMTVVYDGPAGATVNVGPNSSGSNPYTNTNTQPGDVLVINLGNIGNNWYFLVNGAQDADIHASCSDDILNNINSTKSDFGHLGSYPNPDQNSNDGTFLVIGFKDDNGNVCPSGGIQGPNAVDDNVTLIQGDTVGIQVLINDTDPNNNINVSSLTVLSGPSNGSVSVNTSTGIVTYIPNVNFNGSDSFTYLICNNIPVCDTATVYITVNPPVNLPPNAVDDSVSTTQGIPVTIDVKLNDTDPDGDPLTTIILSGPINGTVAILNGDSVVYTPNVNFVGIDIFTYIVSDGNGGTDTATVTINVGSIISNSPVAIDDSANTNPGVPVIIDVQSNDFDPNGDPLTTSILTGPINGTVTILNGDSVVYTPNVNFVGIDIFTYIVSDGNGGTDTATVTINVGSIISNSPVAIDDSANTNPGVPVIIDVQSNDFDPNGDPLTTSILTGPINGTVTILNGDSVVYTPNVNFVGIDIFTYIVSDGNGGTDTATVTINVGFITNPPIAVDDNVSANEDTPVTINVQSNDSGTAPLITSILSGPGNGTATVINGDSILYTPNLNFNGIDTLVYIITYGNGGTDTAIVIITVIPVNDSPVAVDDNASTNVNTPVTIDVQVNDFDVDGDPLTTSIIIGPNNGTATVINGDSILYTPNTGFIGVDTLTYVISDGNGGTDTATVTINIGFITNPPIAVDDNVSANEDTPVTINVQSNDSGTAPLITSILSGPGNGTATVINGDSILYTPNLNFNGIDTLVYIITDGNGGTDTAIVIITVIPVNDSPVAVDDNASTNVNTPVTIDVQDNDFDVDGDPLVTSIFSGPNNGTATILNGDSILYTPNTGFIGVDTLTYIISDGNGGLDTAIVIITVNGPCPVANAGTDQFLCNDTSTTLAGSALGLGHVGIWSVIGGAAIVSTPGSPTSGVSGLTMGSSILVWTVTSSSGTCVPSSDTVVITLNIITIPTIADAGPDQILCNTTSTTLAASPVDTCESGTWTIVAGTGAAINPNSPTTGVIGLTLGTTSQFIWTISGPGGYFSSDSMLITVNAIANAGPNQNLCNTSTTTLSAGAPGPSESGIWTVLSGTAIVTNPGSATSGVTNLATGASSTLIWTITGICGTSSDNVVINVGTTSIANAGSDKNICDSTSTTLSGNLPAVGDTGIWSVVSGSAIVTNPNSPSSGVTNLTIGASSTLIWTITGPCGSNSDTLVINVQSAASITQANAGPDQIICNVTTTLLAANTPGLLESGSWTVISGTAQVTSTSSSTSGVTGLTIGTSSTLVWTITGLCGTTTDTLLITVNSIASAGPDQNLCNTTTSILSAIAPGPSGSGIWTVLSGTAMVTNPGSATSGVTNLTIGASSTLIWTITGICGTSSDNVILNVGTTPGVNAGSDKNLCDSTSTTLSGNLPAVGDTGIWSVISGTAMVANPNSPTSGVTNLSVGASSVLIWIITGPCGSNSDTLVINVKSSASITQADAGLDQELCDTITTTSLNANTPGAGENGIWTVIAGTAIVSNPNVPTSGVTGLTLGSSTLVWTISNACASSSDTLFLNVTTGGNCCVNLPLTAVDDIANPDEDTPITIFVLANDVDPEFKIDASSLNVVDLPTKGLITINTIAGTILYEPGENYFGSDSLTYAVRDTGCLIFNWDTAIVRIQVNSVNDCPDALDDTVTTLKNISVEIDATLNDIDIDGNLITGVDSILAFPNHGTATINQTTGEIIYTPFLDFIGVDSITYLICDNGTPICCDSATIVIKVVGDCDICVPQCLSPNGDFIGDVLEIKCIENYPNNDLRIFNRWGNCVYEMKSYDNTWDGTSNTGPVLFGDELHDGTYYYVLDKGDGSKAINGFLVLKRN